MLELDYLTMAKGTKRYVREAEAQAAQLKKKRTNAQLEAANAGITVALEKIRLLRDQYPKSDESKFLEVIYDLKRVRESLLHTIDDLEERVRPETDDEGDNDPFTQLFEAAMKGSSYPSAAGN